MVSIMFYFHPYLGKSSNFTNIFPRGWNHQPAIIMIMIEIYYSLLDAVWQKSAQVPTNWCFFNRICSTCRHYGGCYIFCQKPIHHINMYSVYVDITSTIIYIPIYSHTYIYIYDISRWYLDESCSFKYSSTKTLREGYTSTICSKKDLSWYWG